MMIPIDTDDVGVIVSNCYSWLLVYVKNCELLTLRGTAAYTLKARDRHCRWAAIPLDPTTEISIVQEIVIVCLEIEHLDGRQCKMTRLVGNTATL